jgi:hypothetical protein
MVEFASLSILVEPLQEGSMEDLLWEEDYQPGLVQLWECLGVKFVASEATIPSLGALPPRILGCWQYKGLTAPCPKGQVLYGEQHWGSISENGITLRPVLHLLHPGLCIIHLTYNVSLPERVVWCHCQSVCLNDI